MSYQDWVTAILSVLGMALTVLGVVIAVLAIWGYRSIREEAIKSAEVASLKAVEKYFDGAGIPEKLKALVEERLAADADQVFKDLNLTADVNFSGEVKTVFIPALPVDSTGEQDGGTL